MLAFLEGPELIIVLIIVLLVFGSSKVPQLARSLGEAQREFKKAMSDNHAQDEPATPTSNVDTPGEPPTGGGEPKLGADGPPDSPA